MCFLSEKLGLNLWAAVLKEVTSRGIKYALIFWDNRDYCLMKTYCNFKRTKLLPSPKREFTETTVTVKMVSSTPATFWKYILNTWIHEHPHLQQQQCLFSVHKLDLSRTWKKQDLYYQRLNSMHLTYILAKV